MYIYTRPGLGKAICDTDDVHTDSNIGAPAKKPIPAGSLSVVNTKLPKEGDGYIGQKEHRWGLKEVIFALEMIGLVWKFTHPTAPRIQLRDISRKGGGPTPKDRHTFHNSHQMGLDVDIRPMRKDGKESVVSFTNNTYSQDLTQDLVDIIHKNIALEVQLIFFDDPKIKRVKKIGGHAKHLHIRFCMPPKYRPVLEPFDRWTGKNRGCDDPASDVPPMMRAEAKPGQFYKIKKGDTLFGITGRAYNVSPGSQRLKLAQHVNNAKYNRRFWQLAPQNEIKWFPEGRISFSPRFVEPMEQIKFKKKAPAGNYFALIWIPPRPQNISVVS